MSLYYFKCGECYTEYFVKCDEYGYPSGVVELTCPCGEIMKPESNANLSTLS